MVNPHVTDFGLELRQHRINFGYSIKYIADRIDKSPSTVTAIENGTLRAPKASVLKKWLTALHLEDQFERMNERARLNRNSLSVKLKSGNKANRHIVRVLDAYEAGELSSYDMDLLSLVARIKSPYKEKKHEGADT